jgi:CRISPR/Cas system CSM-associated protein Csm4 (group 5 of RAMP superfamily)
MFRVEKLLPHITNSMPLGLRHLDHAITDADRPTETKPLGKIIFLAEEVFAKWLVGKLQEAHQVSEAKERVFEKLNRQCSFVEIFTKREPRQGVGDGESGMLRCQNESVVYRIDDQERFCSKHIPDDIYPVQPL